MLRLRHGLAAALLAGLIIYGCKKDHDLQQNTFTPDNTAVFVRDWLSKQKTDSLVAITVNNLQNQADWQTAHTVDADSGKIYRIVTLKSVTTFDDPDKIEQRFLTLITQNEITTASIYNLYGSKADVVSNTDDAISNFEKKGLKKLQVKSP